MPRKTAAPPPDPAADVRRRLEEARDLVARLEADHVAATQDEEAALERGDTSGIVAARGRATAAADALSSHREKVCGLAAELAAIEAVEAVKAAKARLSRLCTLMTAARADYEAEAERVGDGLEKAARKLLELRDSYFETLRQADNELATLGTSLAPPAGHDGYRAWQHKSEALREELSEMGAPVEHLRFEGYGAPPAGWQRRSIPQTLGVGILLERLVDGLAHERAVARMHEEREAASHAA
jgi:hypothetical protein